MISQFDDIIYNTISSLGWPSGMNYQDFFALIASVIQKESSFNPNAVSSDSVHIGLMQVEADTWGYSSEQLFDPAINIYMGASILIQYINKYGLTGGLGAYFAGPAQRFTQAAKSYAQIVLNYFQSFKNKVIKLFSPSGGEYFTGQFTEQFPQIDAGNISNLPPISIDPTMYYTLPAVEQDYTWIYVAAGIFLLIMVMQNA